jgi:hypothetical protein
MDKHCGNCSKQDWCPANEGDGGNTDCTDWLDKDKTELIRKRTNLMAFENMASNLVKVRR